LLLHHALLGAQPLWPKSLWKSMAEATQVCHHCHWHSLRGPSPRVMAALCPAGDSTGKWGIGTTGGGGRAAGKGCRLAFQGWPVLYGKPGWWARGRVDPPPGCNEATGMGVRTDR